MKKNLFYLFALICSMSLFTACSDDDEAPGNSGVVGEVVGDYKGLMDVYYEPNVEIAKGNYQEVFRHFNRFGIEELCNNGWRCSDYYWGFSY